MKRAIPVLAALALSACGTDVSGPSSSLISCAFGKTATLEVGEVLHVAGDGNQAVCLAGGGGSDYVYIPFFAIRSPEPDDPEVSISVEVSGGGFEPASASTRLAGQNIALQALTGTGRTRVPWDREFHRRLREREIRELEWRIRPAPADPTAGLRSVAARVPVVGELRDFNTAISCTERDIRTGRVMYVSDHAVVMADTSNPADLSSSDYAYFGVTFDTLVYPVETAHFGAPTDIDENGRSILFFTGAVNELTAPSDESVTIGFFWSGDLFPEEDTPRLEACPEANESEMFYLIAPDPDGVLGRAFDLEEVRRLAIPLIGHEFQHLINASRRLFVNNATRFERPWLNEGLSHTAEELLFLAVSGLEPGSNLTEEDLRQSASTVRAFNEYMGGNFSNFGTFLEEPDTASLMGIDNLSTRGATWNFLRYAADRSSGGDEEFFFDVVNGTDAGLNNLNDVISDGTALDWMRDWTVSVYADDLVPGLAPRYQVATWNLRSIYEGSTFDEYPLRVLGLQSGGSTTVDLMAGGTSYYRFGVAADGRAAVHIEADGDDPPRTLRGSFIRVR
jgi:hypothetical protein